MNLLISYVLLRYYSHLNIALEEYLSAGLSPFSVFGHELRHPEYKTSFMTCIPHELHPDHPHYTFNL